MKQSFNYHVYRVFHGIVVNPQKNGSTAIHQNLFVRVIVASGIVPLRFASWESKGTPLGGRPESTVRPYFLKE